MQAASKVLSLDREAFPSLNGLPGETLHSVSLATQFLYKRFIDYKNSLFHNTIYFLQYIADRNVENNPWYGFEEWSLKVCIVNVL